MGGPVPNENVEPQVKKLLSISRWGQLSIKPRAGLFHVGGPTEPRVMGDSMGHMPVKPALLIC